MLMELATAEGEENELFEKPRCYKWRKMEGRSQAATGDVIHRGSNIKVAILGRERSGFMAVTQISQRTLYRHVADVTSSRTVKPYKTLHALGRSAKKSFQSTLAMGSSSACLALEAQTFRRLELFVFCPADKVKRASSCFTQPNGRICQMIHPFCQKLEAKACSTLRGLSN